MKRRKLKKKIDYTSLLSLFCFIIILVMISLFVINEDKKVNYSEGEIKSYFSSFGQCATGYKLDFGDDKVLRYNGLPKEFINNTIFNYLKYSGKVESNKDNNMIKENDPKIESFTKKDLKKAIKYIYGNVEYDLSEDFDLGDYSFSYDNKYISIRKEEPNCINKKIDGYDIDNIKLEDDKLYVDILFYNYEMETKDKTCFRIIQYGTKDNEQFINNNNSNFIKEHKEHFLKYRFVFKKDRKSYIFDYVEEID